MIISFTVNNLNNGGAERVICNLANQLSRDGHDVRIICYAILKDFYFNLDNNVQIIELDKDINNRKSIFKRKIAGIVNLKKLYDAVKGSDRVVSFYTRQNCYSILVSSLQGIPVICAERDHFFMEDGKINHIMRKFFYPHASGFIHQTEMMRSWLRSKEGVRSKDIVIPNPLWIDTYPQRDPIEGNIVAVGRLAEQKNYEQMIEAFSIVHRKFPNANLNIYGEGPLKVSLQKIIDENNLNQSVQLKGITKNVLEVYQKAQIFVMFSKGEGYPNALMEALAVGVPSISSDCPAGGPRDMIVNGKNGFLVKPGDVIALVDRMGELLSNPLLRDQFSNNAISIRETNKNEKIYHQIKSFLEEIK